MSQKGAIRKIFRYAFRKRRENMNENKFSANEGIISMINEEQQPSVIFANEFDDITCEVNII